MRIESGPTVERRVRSTLALILFAGFALWFARDGWIAWANENIEKYLAVFPLEQRDAVRTGPWYDKVTIESAAQAETALEAGRPDAVRQALSELYGGPPTLETDETWYYLGPVGQIRVSLRQGRPTGVKPVKPEHSAGSIQIQKVLAAALGVLAAVMFIHVIRVFATRLVLDDSGLVYRGGGPIGWDAMKRLDSAKFDKKGWVDLYHTRNGDERPLRLDEYHVARFEDVIDEICAIKGFANPLPEEEEHSEDSDSDDATPKPTEQSGD